jgi:LysR family transcriptional regulator, nitrogen assimilation regulatory protein
LIVELNALEYFWHVAEAGSISRAAIELGIEQSTLTRQIHRLEDTVGTKLFHRSGRGMLLNDQGQVLLSHAQEVMAAATRARQAVSALSSEGPGQIIIAAQPTIALTTFPQIGHALLTAFPRTKLRFMEGLGHQIIKWLQEGVVDVAVLYLPQATKIVDFEVLLEEPLYCIGPGSADPSRDRISAKELLALPLVLPSTHHGLRTLVESLSERYGIAANIAVECDASTQLTRKLVQMKHGYTILPMAAVAAEVSAGTLHAVRLDDPAAVRSVALATASGRPQVQSSWQIRRLIKTSIQDLVIGNGWPGAILLDTAE